MWPFKSKEQRDREEKILRLKQELKWYYEVLGYLQKREESTLERIDELEKSLKELKDAK